MQALLFKPDKIEVYLVFGSIFNYTGDFDLELSVNNECETIEQAEKIVSFLKEQYSENHDIGIQKHTVEKI